MLLFDSEIEMKAQLLRDSVLACQLPRTHPGMELRGIPREVGSSEKSFLVPNVSCLPWIGMGGRHRQVLIRDASNHKKSTIFWQERAFIKCMFILPDCVNHLT